MAIIHHHKPAHGTNLPLLLPARLAKRYVSLHKQWRWVFWLVALIINLALIVTIHEISVHLTAAVAFSAWDATILAVE